MTHCIASHAPCTCHKACGVHEQPAAGRIILNTSLGSLAPDIGLLEKYPKCLAIGEIYSSWSKAKKTEHADLFRNADLFRIAKQKEIDQMLDPNNPTLEKVPISQKPKDAKVFQSHMLFSLKSDGENNITKGKAMGFWRQYTRTYAPLYGRICFLSTLEQHTYAPRQSSKELAQSQSR